MQLSAEHVPSWENDHKGLGEAGEKLVRSQRLRFAWRRVLRIRP